MLTPGLVFAADGKPFARAIEAAVPTGCRDRRHRAIRSADRQSTPFADLRRDQPTAAVDAAHAKVGPDTIAKFLFTSGSTGNPEGRDQHPAHAVLEPGA